MNLPYLIANRAVIATEIYSAFMVPLESFVQTNVANVAVKSLVTVYSNKEQRQQHEIRSLYCRFNKGVSSAS